MGEMKLSSTLCASIVALAALGLTANGVSADQSNDQQTLATPKSKPRTKRNKTNVKTPKPHGASSPSTMLQDQIKQEQENAAQKQQYRQLESQMKQQQAQLNGQIAAESQETHPAKKNPKKKLKKEP